MYGFLVVFSPVSSFRGRWYRACILVFKVSDCNDRLVIRIQTILGLDTCINVLVDELNNLKHKHVREILIVGKDDNVQFSHSNG